jgi:aconitate hydratase
MGLLPLQFKPGTTRRTLALDGSERLDVLGLAKGVKPGMELTLRLHRADGRQEDVPVLARIDTVDEVEYFRHGGILKYVLRALRAN